MRKSQDTYVLLQPSACPFSDGPTSHDVLERDVKSNNVRLFAVSRLSVWPTNNTIDKPLRTVVISYGMIKWSSGLL